MEKLTIALAQQLAPYIQKAQYNECNSNIVALLMWNHVYAVNVEFHEHFALILIQYAQSYAWLMPFCEKKDRLEALNAMKKYSQKHHFPFEIHGMTQEFKQFCEIHESLIYHEEINAFDYVYDAFMHRHLKGKKMQKRRNHFNAFLSLVQNNFIYKPLEDSDIPFIFSFLDKWIKQRPFHETLNQEILGIQYLLNHFDELNLCGGCIYIHHQLEAFCIASHLTLDTLQIHVEKANHEIRGIYVALSKYFLMDHEAILYINREDDMGIENIRKAKHDLHPLYQIKKYTAFAGKTKIIQANDFYFDSIQQLWLQAFHDETPLTTDFYFHHLYQKENTFLILYENHLIAMLQIRKINLSFPSQNKEAFLIIGVAVQPYYQHCGYMKQLMNHVLALYSDSLLLIQANHWDLYRPFGFHEAYYLKKVEYHSSHTFPCLPSCQDASHLWKIYQRFTQDKQGYRIRELDYFEKYLIPYIQLEGEIYANLEAYICIYRHEKHYVVSECATTCLQALIELLEMFEGIIEVHCDIHTALMGKSQIIPCMFIRRSLPSTSSLYINEIF